MDHRSTPEDDQVATGTAGRREPAEQVREHQHVVQAEAAIPVDPRRTRELLGDLSLMPEWLSMHASWRGRAPGTATTGSTFAEQVKIMGIPAEISWEVSRAEPETLVLLGHGPMRLQLLLWFTIDEASAGSLLRLDCGLSGDPVTGPMGGSIVQSVQEALAESLTTLAGLPDTGAVAGSSATGGAAVRHEATGTMMDSRTPVIVGAGQIVQRRPDPGNDPVALAVEALREAEKDSGVDGLLTRADGVCSVASASWTYRDQSALVAERVGAEPAETVQSARFGGDGGQTLINDAAQSIADGAASVVLVCGAEAGASLAAAQKQGDSPEWPQQSSDVQPTRTVGSEREANNTAEGAAGLGAPVYTYALLESAIRGKAGRGIEEHRQWISELWSGFSGIAEHNEYAWQPTSFTAERLAEADADNRMVSAPYPKLLCANLQVDLASGLILTSAAAAEAAGIPQDRWVFPHAGAAANDEWFVSERGDLASSPAIRTIGHAALTEAGLGIDQIAHIDLYSCFPAAVQIAAAELGLPVNDPDRPLSVTGGLTFAGGPGNNYGGHAVATLVRRLRADPESYGLSTSLGWYLTKHAMGIYSARPPATLFRSLAPVVAPVPTRPAPTGYTGPAVVEAYTVQYKRSGATEAAIVSAIAPHGERVLVRVTEPDVVTAFAQKDPLGWTVAIGPGHTARITDRGRTAIPDCPPMPVLVEDRGPIRVITINRPDRRNAIDLATAQLLERVIDAFEADDDVRVAVLTGAGGTFSAGMDLKAAARGEFALTERRGPLGIARLPIVKPLIAAVEGHALAGGCELALVADLIVASEESEFGIPEPKRGLVAAAGGVLRLAQRLPRNVAMELALTGDSLGASRLAELGLVNRIAAPGKALETAVELAGRIVLNAPISVAASKEIVEQCDDWSRDEEFQRQSDFAGRALFSADAGEGVAAFAEHRAPVWQGR